jgi:hypothetical protein
MMIGMWIWWIVGRFADRAARRHYREIAEAIRAFN